MHLLIVAATQGETTMLRTAMPFREVQDGTFRLEEQNRQIALLHTGIGMVNTAWTLGRWTQLQPDFDKALNIGIAGSYRRDWALGTVVQCTSDCFAEMGASSPEGFLDMKQLGFPIMEWAGSPIYNSLKNPDPWPLDLPLARAITVNQVQGEIAGITTMQQQWQPEVETMEGAAFFQAMLRLGKPFAAIRSISNYVEPRNRESWKIGLALHNLTEAFVEWWKTQ